jgi:hypothetical protein
MEVRIVDHIYVNTIAVLPNVTEDDFERHVIQVALPGTEVTHGQ